MRRVLTAATLLCLTACSAPSAAPPPATTVANTPVPEATAQPPEPPIRYRRSFRHQRRIRLQRACTILPTFQRCQRERAYLPAARASSTPAVTLCELPE